MRRDWDGVAFTVVPYKETGTFVIGGIDEIQALLDDQTVRVAAMRSSPFIAHVAKAAAVWAEIVETLQVRVDSRRLQYSNL
jgi:dynein heavy chain, axonemal